MGLRAQCPSSMPIGRYYDRPPAVSEAFLWRFSYPQQVLQREKIGRNLVAQRRLSFKRRHAMDQMMVVPSRECIWAFDQARYCMGASFFRCAMARNAQKCQIAGYFCEIVFSTWKKEAPMNFWCTTLPLGMFLSVCSHKSSLVRLLLS